MSRPVPRSSVSLGVYWASRVTTVGFEFALPPLVGGYLDHRWRSGSVLTIVGAILGFLIGMTHILAIAREASKEMPGERAATRDESNESG